MRHGYAALVLFFFVALAIPPAAHADPCFADFSGTPKYASDTADGVQRTIWQFGSHYIYQLEFTDAPEGEAAEATYTIALTLNGQSATVKGQLFDGGRPAGQRAEQRLPLVRRFQQQRFHGRTDAL